MNVFLIQDFFVFIPGRSLDPFDQAGEEMANAPVCG